MAGKKTTRCPLQALCERKCQYEGHELDCDFYAVNGIGSNVIEDQEVIRRERERKRQEELDEQRYQQLLEDDPDGPNIIYLPIEQLHPHPNNPRKEIGDVTELADSIRAKGVFQNLTVVRGHWMTQDEWAQISARYKEEPSEELRKTMNNRWLDTDYTIVIGHRRRAGAKLAGLTQLPCAIVEMTPKEQVETMLLENMQREDLTPYEQAQGFQMMIDMGDTVEEIVQKTGFSKKTVKRRLKMAELDPTVLKEVSSRQISMEDFDTLAKIEDIGQRNECLKNIGTANFAIDVQKKIKKQNIEKNLPWVKAQIRKAKGNKITRTQTYYGNHTQVGNDINIHELTEETQIVPDTGTKKLYYCLDEDTGRLSFYVEREKPAPVRRPQAEIDREKAMAEANEKCAELSALCYKLRSEFVKKLSYGSKNQKEMLYGLVRAIISHGFHYASVSSSDLFAILGEERKWESGEEKGLTERLLEKPASTYPGIVYAAFCDEDTEVYHTNYKKQWPKHHENLRLDALYAWLTSVGYVMSDDEKAMQDGTHELLHLGEPQNSQGQ